jgi:hypothetical protein
MPTRPNRVVMIAGGIIALTGLATACSQDIPVRLVVDADTLLSSSSRPMAVSVRAVGRDGGLVRHARLSYSSNSNVVQVRNDGHVACTRSGDAVVTVAVRALTAHVVVLCRWRLWLGLVPDLWHAPFLWVGGPPLVVSVIAYDSGNRPVHLPHGTATVRVHDDSVARIIGGRVYALSSGRTSVDLAFDGVSGDASIEVVERVIHDSLQLAGHEYRRWRLPPGYYEMRLDSLPEQTHGTGLRLVAYDANCAHAPRETGQHYFCILKVSSSVIVQNTRPVGSGPELRGELTVFRLP